MKMKKMQYEYTMAAIPYNREIDYIHRIFYLNDYIKEILTFCNSDVFEKKYVSAWDKMNSDSIGKILFIIKICSPTIIKFDSERRSI